MHSLFVSCLLFFALVSFETSSSSSECMIRNDLEAYAQRRCREVLSNRVKELLRENRNDTIAIWIFFDSRDSLSIFKPSSKATSRRLSRSKIFRDDTDIPVRRDYVDRLEEMGIRIRHVSRYFNAASANASLDEIKAIACEPFVRFVDTVARSRRPWPSSGPRFRDCGFLGSSPGNAADPYGGSRCQLEQIGAAFLLDRGFDGSGFVGGSDPVKIAILDTGFRTDHEAFADLKVEAQWDFVQGDSVTSNQSGDSPYQDMHGTAVLGVIAGKLYGEHFGPACGAVYLLAKTEIVDLEIISEEDNWVAGIEWADSAGADIVTSSLGYYEWYTPADLDGKTALCTKAAEIAVSHGIVVVNAAGNRGFAGLVTPADGENVIAVGAVDCSGAIAYFSSRGPTADGRIKPDFVALGLGVQSVAYGDTLTFEHYNGTSLATPLVAGICAQLLEIHRDWSPQDLLYAMRSTSSRSGFPDNDYGYGIPDAELAAISERTPSARIVPFPNPFSSEVRMRVNSKAGSPVSIRVYDCTGALVRILAEGKPAREEFTLTWDGKNQSGRKVSAGVYFVAVESKDSRSYSKLVLLK